MFNHLFCVCLQLQCVQDPLADGSASLHKVHVTGFPQCKCITTTAQSEFESSHKKRLTEFCLRPRLSQINYYFINTEGHPIEGWAVMYYITHL